MNKLKIWQVALLMYGFFALLLVLARLALIYNWLNIIPESFGFVGSAAIFVLSLFAPIALFGPGVLTVLLVYRFWPGKGIKKFIISLLPATVLSAAITPIFWILISDNQIDWAVLLGHGNWIPWAVSWITGTTFVQWLDDWFQHPRKLSPTSV